MKKITTIILILPLIFLVFGMYKFYEIGKKEQEKGLEYRFSLMKSVLDSNNTIKCYPSELFQRGGRYTKRIYYYVDYPYVVTKDNIKIKDKFYIEKNENEKFHFFTCFDGRKPFKEIKAISPYIDRETMIYPYQYFTSIKTRKESIEKVRKENIKLYCRNVKFVKSINSRYYLKGYTEIPKELNMTKYKEDYYFKINGKSFNILNCYPSKTRTLYKQDGIRKNEMI